MGGRCATSGDPVRLRTRIAQAVPPPRPSIAAAAGAAAVAAVLVWVVLRSRDATAAEGVTDSAFARFSDGV